MGSDNMWPSVSSFFHLSIVFSRFMFTVWCVSASPLLMAVKVALFEKQGLWKKMIKSKILRWGPPGFHLGPKSYVSVLIWAEGEGDLRHRPREKAVCWQCGDWSGVSQPRIASKPRSWTRQGRTLSLSQPPVKKQPCQPCQPSDCRHLEQ